MEYEESGFQRGTLIKIAAIITDAALLILVFPYQIVINRKRKSVSMRSILMSIMIRTGGSNRQLRCSFPGISIKELKRTLLKKKAIRKKADGRKGRAPRA